MQKSTIFLYYHSIRNRVHKDKENTHKYNPVTGITYKSNDKPGGKFSIPQIKRGGNLKINGVHLC